MAEDQTARALIKERIADLWAGEDFLAALFSSFSKYGIVVADFDGNVLAMNGGAATMYGWDPEEVVAKRPIEVLFPPEEWTRESPEDAVGCLLERGRHTYECVRRRKDGDTFQAAVTIVGARGKSGELVGYLDVAEDITERDVVSKKEASIRAKEEQIGRLTRELEGLGRVQGPEGAATTADLIGIGPISRALPETFSQFTAEYSDVMDLALERRAYRRETDVSSRLEDIAGRLGLLGAGPKDVLEIHTAVLKQKVTEAKGNRGQAYVEEGRLLVLEMMGHVLSFYRVRRDRRAVVQAVRSESAVTGGSHG